MEKSYYIDDNDLNFLLLQEEPHGSSQTHYHVVQHAQPLQMMTFYG